MPLDVQPNQEFLEFISIQGDKKNLQNLDLILELESSYPSIFTKVMSNFNRAKHFIETRTMYYVKQKIVFDDIIIPKNNFLKEVLIDFYNSKGYKGETNENADIAGLFDGAFRSQWTFDKAIESRQETERRNVPEHILGQHLIEETQTTYLERIERIKKKTEEELAIGEEIIKNLGYGKFTYELLSKRDIRNPIMGWICDFGIDDYGEYGIRIDKSSVIAPDVQNLVVRNSEGDIIASGTMYVNKENGYAVINAFDLHRRYRKHEYSPGLYRKAARGEVQERNEIFNAFKRGLNAFIEEYDRQNPENPLTQINIGLGHNRLRGQLKKYKLAYPNYDSNFLTVPWQYHFLDAGVFNKQRIFYKREKKNTNTNKREGGR